MRRLARSIVVLFAFVSCTSESDIAPAGPVSFSDVPGSPALGDVNIESLPAVRFSEIHYDNAGTDAGEAIEVSGPAGMDVSGWKICLYNGNGGATYEPTRTLTGAFPATCDTRGVLVQNYPSNGIQNGDPDGIALVDASGAVVEFLSYEGTFTAADGPAPGTGSTDIGLRGA